MANRIQQLNQIAQQIPNLDQRAATRNKDARTALMQQQLGALPEVSKQQVQQIGTQQAGLAAQQQVEQLKQSQQAAGQVGQLALQEQQRVGAGQLARKEMSQQESQQQSQNAMAQRLQKESLDSRKQVNEADLASAQRLQAAGFDVDNRLQVATQKQRQDLSRLGNDIKSQLLDSRIAFEKDDRGRKFSNTRQMADYAVASAKSQQDLDNKLQTMAQEEQMKAILLDGLRDRLMTIQKQGFIDSQGDLDAAANIELAKMAAQAQEEAARSAADAKNKQSIWSTAGSILGGLVGLVGGAPGVAIGSVVGGAVGGGINSIFGE